MNDLNHHCPRVPSSGRSSEAVNRGVPTPHNGKFARIGGATLSQVAVFAALLFSPQSRALAQHFGLFGGATQSHVTLESANVVASPEGTRTAPTAGLFAQWRAANWLIAEPEAMITIKGQAANDQSGLRLTYLEIPALAHISWPTSTRFAPFIDAGPSVGFLLDCSTDGGPFTCSDDPFRTKRIDLAGALGAGLEFGGANGLRDFGAEVRYERSLLTTAVTGSAKRINHTLYVLLRLGRIF
jgi:hypothetical protein